MTQDRKTPLDQHLHRLGRTSDVEIAASSFDALLERAQASSHGRAPLPLLALASEHVRERRIAERDPATGLKGPRAVYRWLREAWRLYTAPRAPLLLRVELTLAPRDAAGKLELLRSLAEVLEDNVARHDFVARTAENELTVLMQGVDPRHAPSIQARLGALCERVAARHASPASTRITLELLNKPDAT